MPKRKLYFIAGPNGAGKTTASHSLLPELWECSEFVNADEIARGLSPFNPNEMAIEAGRIQLMRISQLLENKESFSVETTLATRSYVRLIAEAHKRGYEVELLFFYLPSADDAQDRVRLRVLSGGHNIPLDVIRRRFDLGLSNLFNLYIPIVDKWSIYNNIVNPSLLIASNENIIDSELFNHLKAQYGK